MESNPQSGQARGLDPNGMFAVCTRFLLPALKMESASLRDQRLGPLEPAKMSYVSQLFHFFTFHFFTCQKQTPGKVCKGLGLCELKRLIKFNKNWIKVCQRKEQDFSKATGLVRKLFA